MKRYKKREYWRVAKKRPLQVPIPYVGWERPSLVLEEVVELCAKL